jgi:hypothetical protein
MSIVVEIVVMLGLLAITPLLAAYTIKFLLWYGGFGLEIINRVVNTGNTGDLSE